MHAFGSPAIGEAGLRVEDPDVWDAHVEVVCDALLHGREAVFGRKNLDADEGRLGEDLFRRSFECHADIRHAEPRRRDLHTLFREDGNAQFLAAIIDHANAGSCK